MIEPQFIGRAIHTTLGFGLDANLQALCAPPRAPQRIEVACGADRALVPYHLLADAPLALGEDRCETVIERVVGAALDEAGLTSAQRHQTALFVGSSSFDIGVGEARYRRELSDDSAAVPLMGYASIANLAMRLCRRFDLRGPDFSINTACTASANALMQAVTMIRSGSISHAVLVGVELFNATTALGFHGLELLTAHAMTPFDRARDGLALGESCAAVVLGPDSGDGFYLRGAANLCDRHAISAANPDGSTVAAVMQRALRSANIDAARITAIKTHGTASLLNDEAEVAGMRQVFAQLPPLAAFKPHLGHTLGACGLSEAMLLLGAIERGFITGTSGVCAQESDLGVTLIQQPLPVGRGNFMLNYFGFGGSNTTLIFSNEART